MADTVAPLEGTTTVDDKVTFEPIRLSYEAGHDVAVAIAAEIAAEIRGRQVVVADNELLTDLANLVATRSVLDGIAKDYDDLGAHSEQAAQKHAEGVAMGLQPPAKMLGVTPALSAATAAVQAGLSLVSLFRQNVEVRGEAVTVDASAFEIEMAASLRAKGAAQVFVPELFVFDAPLNGEQSLRAALFRAQQARSQTWSRLAPLVAKLAALEAQLDAAASKGQQQEVDDSAAAVRDLRGTIDPVLDPLSRVDQRLNQLQNQLAAADAQAGGLTLLARLFRAEGLRARDPLIVHVRVVAAGGSNRTKHTLLGNAFTGDGLSSMGGVVVSWALLDIDGSVTKGGTVTHSHTAPFPKLSEEAAVRVR